MNGHKSYLYKLAEGQSRMYTWEGQYLVRTWDEGKGCYRESYPMDYWRARAIVERENCTHPQDCTTHNHA